MHQFRAGKTITVNVDSSDLVEILKKKIYGQEGIPLDQQELFIIDSQDGLRSNLPMDDCRLLSDYNIVKSGSSSSLFLLLSQGRGDMTHNHVIAREPAENAQDVAPAKKIILIYQIDGMPTKRATVAFNANPFEELKSDIINRFCIDSSDIDSIVLF